MSKRPSFSSALQKLDALRANRPADEQNPHMETRANLPAPEGPTDLRSSILEESLSGTDSVPKEQGASTTGSSSHPVHSEPSPGSTLSNVDTSTVSNADNVKGEQNPGQTECKADSVQSGPAEKRTVSRLDTVPDPNGGNRPTRRSAGFTAVTHDLLRGEAKFRDPIDFMVYMHLYSYSHGFGRQTADMSQSQLERFTGSTRNTIKRSLERLVKDGWIRMVEDFECARMSRKWRIFTPEDRRGPRPGRRVETEGFKADGVQTAQGPAMTPGLSKSDPSTGSRIDTYKERIPREKSKHSLTETRESPLPEGLKEYFAELRPERKRQSERAALRELEGDFSKQDIADAIAELQRRGMPGSGEPVHSPLAFLASGGIMRVMAVVRDDRRRREQADARKCAEETRLQRVAEEEVSIERQTKAREAAFSAAFVTLEAQQQAIESYRGRFPGFSATGPALRALAINAWWELQSKQQHAS